MTDQDDDCEHLAAVDLGSNSFHMIRARRVYGELQIVDRVRERVRLAGGLDKDRMLDKESQERGLECLKLFSEHLQGIEPDRVRVVGTNTLRTAKNVREFLDRAEAILAHPIEIISGQEEARLIYQGVNGVWPPGEGPRLVVDIGGGSTEIILGLGPKVKFAISVPLGCVSYSRKFFPDGTLSQSRFKKAIIAAQLELERASASIHYTPSIETLGTSGTVHSIVSLIQDAGIGQSLSLRALKKLSNECVKRGHVDRLEFAGLSDSRRPVIAGGLSVLIAVFKSFGIKKMAAAPAGLREGLLFDLIGRSLHDDSRHRTVLAMSQRFQADEMHSARVEALATRLLDGASSEWKLEGNWIRQMIRWASRLHEVGLAISYSGFHKHGEYMVRMGDMPGFSQDEQALLSTLIRYHRRRFPTITGMTIPALTPERVFRLCLIMRLSTLLTRTRRETLPEGLEVIATERSLKLVFRENFLEDHPLAKAGLEAEASDWVSSGYVLAFQ